MKPIQIYQTKATKLNKSYQNKPSKATTAKPQYQIHKPIWQIQI